MSHTIIKPLITEKSMADAQKGKFSFLVIGKAGKKAIKKIVENKFAVKVTGISTTIVKGRAKRVGKRRNEVKQSPWKKAMVQLAAGQKIGLFELGGK